MDAYAFTARLEAVTPVGLTVRGLRLDIAFRGRVTEGALAGATIEGVDYLLVRPDGVGVIDARERISDGGRALAAVRAHGFVVPPWPRPSPEAILDEGFAWPDAGIPLHGVHFWEPSDPALAAAAATVFGFTGSANLATGALAVSARSLAG